MLMTTAYGAPLSEKDNTLTTLIKDLENLGTSMNVSGWFSCINSLLFVFSTYFCLLTLFTKINFFPLFSTGD